MKRITSFGAMAVLAIAIAPSAWAGACPIYDDTITAFNSNTPNDPPVYFSIAPALGVTGEHFTTCEQSNEIQLGLRITKRQNGLIVPNPLASDLYPLTSGADTDGNLKWNVDVSVDMGYDYGTAALPNELGDLDSLILQYDCEPAIGYVEGPSYDLVKIAGFFPLDLVETTQLIQASDNLGFPGRCAGFEIDPDTPGSYEFTLTASYGGNEIGQTSATAILGEPPTLPAEGTENAAFTVIKRFEDYNVAEVQVKLSCNTGLPLIQYQTISPVYVNELNNQVSFILESLGDSLADCTVTETPVPDGYVAEYVDLTGDGDSSLTGCHYEDVAAGDSVLCGVINHVKPVPVVIEKVWQGTDDETGYLSELALECQNVALDGDTEWHWLVGSLEGDYSFTAWVKPLWTGTTQCEVYEHNFSSGVEVTGCEEPFSVDVGETSAGCTLVNTVFFEGIPTLNQYGMALLALLMLGVGFVGFRRFV